MHLKIISGPILSREIHEVLKPRIWLFSDYNEKKGTWQVNPFDRNSENPFLGAQEMAFDEFSLRCKENNIVIFQTDWNDQSDFSYVYTTVLRDITTEAYIFSTASRIIKESLKKGKFVCSKEEGVIERSLFKHMPLTFSAYLKGDLDQIAQAIQYERRLAEITAEAFELSILIARQALSEKIPDLAPTREEIEKYCFTKHQACYKRLISGEKYL